jgi:hypothetical protein
LLLEVDLLNQFFLLGINKLSYRLTLAPHSCLKLLGISFCLCHEIFDLLNVILGLVSSPVNLVQSTLVVCHDFISRIPRTM